MQTQAWLRFHLSFAQWFTHVPQIDASLQLHCLLGCVCLALQACLWVLSSTFAANTYWKGLDEWKDFGRLRFIQKYRALAAVRH